MTVGVFEDQGIPKPEVHFLSSDCTSTTYAGVPVQTTGTVSTWQSVGTLTPNATRWVAGGTTTFPQRFYATRQGIAYEASSAVSATFYVAPSVVNTMKRLVTIALVYDYFYTGGYHPVAVGRFTPSTAAGDAVDTCAWQVLLRDTAARFQFSYRGTWYVSPILALTQPTGSVWVFQFQFEYNSGVMGVRYRHSGDAVDNTTYTDLRASWPSGARVTADVTTDFIRSLTFFGIYRNPNCLAPTGKLLELRFDAPTVLLDSELARRIFRHTQRRWL